MAKARLTQLSTSVRDAADKKKIHTDAWVLKKFAVMVKRKLTRGQSPRNKEFLDMLAILAGENSDDDDEDKCQVVTMPVVLVTCHGAFYRSIEGVQSDSHADVFSESS